MSNSNQNPKSTADTIEEKDLLKFQLLSAYVGLRTQDVEAIEKDIELTKAKKELAEIARSNALREVRHYQEWLKKEYHLQPNQLVNYADGTIQRDRQIANGNQKTKISTDQKIQEEKEAPPTTEA